jgi:hypothetical protein
VSASEVWFGVPAEVAFDYLADPRNRPEWQSSLRRVELIDDQVAVGQRWVDVTWPGFRPRLRTTCLDRPAYWTEQGSWRGLIVDVAMTFEAQHDGCVVGIEIRGLPGFVTRFAIQDLRRAARILATR